MSFAILDAVSNLEKPDGVIALPWEKSYRLCTQPDHPQALGRIARMIGKNMNEPGAMVLLGADIAAFGIEPEIWPKTALLLAERYWPGSLVICLPQSERPNAGLTQPREALWQDLLSMLPGGVLAAVPACRPGDEPAVTAQAVYDNFGDDVDFVLQDDDAVKDAKAATVIAVDADGGMRILRRGQIVLD